MPQSPMHLSNVSSLELLGRGKVRDIYAVDTEHLLIVATDRLSAFDVVLPDAIPEKGRVLTALSNFWFGRTRHIIPNHLAPLTLDDVLSDDRERELLIGRATVVRRLRPLPIEAIVRGYLAGSGWNEYRQSQSICGIPLPPGLRQAEPLPTPIFTPSSKAEQGRHDENIDFERAAALIGTELAERVRAASLAIYSLAAEFAATRGILIADTKFEFGIDDHDALYLIDEVLTPDSSRFWPSDVYTVGASPPSFDKQYVRDYLETLAWNKTAPGPHLPAEVISRTAEKYLEAERRLLH